MGCQQQQQDFSSLHLCWCTSDPQAGHVHLPLLSLPVSSCLCHWGLVHGALGSCLASLWLCTHPYSPHTIHRPHTRPYPHTYTLHTHTHPTYPHTTTYIPTPPHIPHTPHTYPHTSHPTYTHTPTCIPHTPPHIPHPDTHTPHIPTHAYLTPPIRTHADTPYVPLHTYTLTPLRPTHLLCPSALRPLEPWSMHWLLFSQGLATSFLFPFPETLLLSFESL